MSPGSISNRGSGRILSGISKEELPRQTIKFVYEQLPAWRDDPNRRDEESENKLNLDLCKYLNSKARQEFPMVCFNHEEYQVGRRTVDLSASPSDKTSIDAKVYTVYEPFLVLEGKRLPAPRKDREKEYVTGLDRTSGGIQRFKMGFHGRDQNIAAMIGYVQKDIGANWFSVVNGWILDLARGKIKDQCSWDKSEILTGFESDESECVSRCESSHPRNGSKSSNRLELHHLWIEMNLRARSGAKTG